MCPHLGGLGGTWPRWAAAPSAADCWACISYPHRLCRLKNYELLKFCNINDRSHLLIWQPATSWFFTLLSPVIKSEYFCFGRQLGDCDFFVSQGSWAMTCIPILIAVPTLFRCSVGAGPRAGGKELRRTWPAGREGDGAYDKEPGATPCKTQGWCLGVRDHTSPEPPAPTTLPRHRWEAQGLPSALAANYGSLWDGILDNSVLWCALQRDKLI